MAKPGLPSPTTVKKPWPQWSGSSARIDIRFAVTNDGEKAVASVVRVVSANRHQFGAAIDTKDKDTTRKPSNDGLVSSRLWASTWRAWANGLAIVPIGST
ncbi:unnamed protein product [Vitrella brassicaformis CCMP3155]|uniref:Uncharacterized protein n=1 Tax=Vitrella brassicaformis (strain CCMP3155) TaxID=1169540 RepID=A0A0G4GCY2_VITBC|nr:unnamed protein product [Vitrella brassicaformis CCMP3155]|eukprot:CEM27145.1 unnamed protein product [Vitrella brassicaformis CCMP3155]